LQAAVRVQTRNRESSLLETEPREFAAAPFDEGDEPFYRYELNRVPEGDVPGEEKHPEAPDLDHGESVRTVSYAHASAAAFTAISNPIPAGSPTLS